jgi:hypothetical protein
VRCECLSVKNGQPIACSDNTQCPCGKACVRGQCIPKIIPCPEQQRLNLDTCQCEPLNGSTKPPPTICRNNNDCPEGYECQQGNCVVRQLPPAPTVPEVCDQDSECGPHGVCQDGRCVVTLPKPERPEVPEIQHAIKPHGLPCQANRDCLKGQVCQNGECVPKPSVRKLPEPLAPQCRKSIDCPVGEVCRKGKCVSEDEPSGTTGSEVTGSYTGPGRIRIGPQFGTQVGPGVGGVQPGSSGVQRQIVPKITPQMPVQRVPRRGKVN